MENKEIKLDRVEIFKRTSPEALKSTVNNYLELLCNMDAEVVGLQYTTIVTPGTGVIYSVFIHYKATAEVTAV